MLLALLVIFLSIPVQAMPMYSSMKGTVVEFNATSGNLILDSACEKVTCDNQYVGRFQGKVPGAMDAAAIHKGDLVDAAFQLHPRYFDNMPQYNYEISSWDTRTVYGWSAIGILARYPNGTKLFTRQAFGNVPRLDTPYAGNYTLECKIFNPAMPDYRYNHSYPDVSTLWPATGAFVLVKQDGILRENRTLSVGEQMEYHSPSDNSTISIRFNGGEINDLLWFQAPLSVNARFTVNVRRTPEILENAREPGSPELPLPVSTAILAVGFACCIIAMTVGKR
jgi:hypothetical protein